MKSPSAMRLKAAIRAFAAEEGIPPQVALQNFMFERFFARLAKSPFRDRFVLKGGVLVSQYLGMSRRTTMDVDLTLRNATLSEERLRRILEEVFAVSLDDGVSWTLKSVEPIRENDAYGGLRVKANASFESIVVPFMVDVSTGDVITPGAALFYVKSRFRDNEFYPLMAYNVETVLAEKVEAILSRGVLTTRPRDYYDAYMIQESVPIDLSLFRRALAATATHRGTADVVARAPQLIEAFSQSPALQRQWEKFRREFSFVKGLRFVDVCDGLRRLIVEGTVAERA